MHVVVQGTLASVRRRYHFGFSLKQDNQTAWGDLAGIWASLGREEYC